MKSPTKKVLLSLSISICIVTLVVMEEIKICQWMDMCVTQVTDNVELVLFLLTISILPFSLVTFWMKEEVFRRWFDFAAWYVPLLVVAMFVFPLNVRGGLGTGGAIQETINAGVLIILFSIFIIVSIVKIIRAHKKTNV